MMSPPPRNELSPIADGLNLTVNKIPIRLQNKRANEQIWVNITSKIFRTTILQNAWLIQI